MSHTCVLASRTPAGAPVPSMPHGESGAQVYITWSSAQEPGLPPWPWPGPLQPAAPRVGAENEGPWALNGICPPCQGLWQGASGKDGA